MTNNPSFKATEAGLNWRAEKAAKVLKKWGYTDEQIALVIRETQLNSRQVCPVDDKCRNRTFG